MTRVDRLAPCASDGTLWPAFLADDRFAAAVLAPTCLTVSSRMTGMSCLLTSALYHELPTQNKAARWSSWFQPIQPRRPRPTPIYDHSIRDGVTLPQEQAAEVLAGRWHVNVMKGRHPGGEMRGQIIPTKQVFRCSGWLPTSADQGAMPVVTRSFSGNTAA